MPDEVPRVEEDVALKVEYSFGIVLLLLLCTFMVMSSGSTATWTKPVTVALQGATLLAALYAANSNARLRTAALVLVILLFIASLFTIPLDGSLPVAGTAIMSGVLVAL